MGRLLETLEGAAHVYRNNPGRMPLTVWLMVTPESRQQAEGLIKERFSDVPFILKDVEERASTGIEGPWCPACGRSMFDVRCKLVCQCGYRET